MAREENGRLKEGMGMFQKELERLSAENRILKRAVGIQNTKGKEVGLGLGRETAAAALFVVRDDLHPSVCWICCWKSFRGCGYPLD